MSDIIETDIIFEINETFKINKNANIYLYPNCEVNNKQNIYAPKVMQQITIDKLELSNTIIIEETTLRDLIKITQNNTITFATKHTTGQVINGHLLISTTYTEIHMDQFPYTGNGSTNGLINTVKKIQIVNISNLELQFTELLLINNVFCIRIKQKPSSSIYKKELRKEITNIIKFIDDQII